MIEAAKHCLTCGETKPHSEFSKNRARKDGLNQRCRSCAKKYQDKWYKKNKESQKKRRDQWRINNKERIKQYDAQYRRANRGIRNAEKAKRRAAKKQATPFWADQAAIKNIYVIAAKANEGFSALGINEQLQVDHIVPLQNDVVCGLHVPNNLQLLTALENASKNNKFNIN